MDSFYRDLKHSIRIFLQNPRFTIAAVAALAFGIGTNTAIFSVVNTVLLKPLKAPEGERVVSMIATAAPGPTGRGYSNGRMSEIKFNLWREQEAVLQDFAAYRATSVTLTGVDQPREVRVLHVTADYFRLFGLKLTKGRTFSPAELRTGGPKAVILSDAFWKNVLGGDPQLPGKVISLNGESHEVVGLMAADAETDNAEPVDAWIPFPIEANSSNQVHYFSSAARLKPGVTLEAANAQMLRMTQDFRKRYPEALSNVRIETFSLQPLQELLVRDVRLFLYLLAGAVGFVMLIACANVANLLLVRASVRGRELAIRMAVGASRGRIIRQMLAESLMLSLAGGALGLVLGWVGIRLLLAFSPAAMPRVGEGGENVAMDWQVLTFAFVLALCTGLLFGLFPALHSSRTDLGMKLKESAGRSGTGLHQNRVQSLLVVSEIALSLLLLIGAALLIRTMVALRSVNPGFDPKNVWVMRATPDPRIAKTSGVEPIVREAVRRVGALPGVEIAATARMVPLSGETNSLPIIVVGRPMDGPSHGFARVNSISASYFQVMKIPLIQGRGFTDDDRLDTPGVAIVNQTLARRVWPSGDPVNSSIFIGRGLGMNLDEPARQVVGIAADVRENSLAFEALPAVYVPLAQLSDARRLGSPLAWFVRLRSPSPTLNASIQNELRLATGAPVAPPNAMEDLVQRSTARQDFNMLLMSVFAGASLLLAAMGIYGLMAYVVQQRKQEIGIRMALGAEGGIVRRMVVWQGMRLVLIGAATGVLAALSLTRLMTTLLFGVEPLDPVAFVAVPVLLAAVAWASVWLPARRASRVDPIQVLRHE